MLIRVYSLLCLFLCLCIGNPLYAKTYTVDGDVIGAMGQYRVKKNDNLSAIARHFDIGIIELLSANPGLSQQSLKTGAKLKIATMHVLPDVPRQGIVLNLSELRLFYFVDADTVMTFPVTIGREGWLTPLGSTSIVKKRKDPAWIPTQAIREENPNLPDIIPAGPDNPLGLYALNLGWAGYAIHGTNRPSSIGKRASHGCIRLYPEDIESLFDAVEVGTPVTIIDAPYKLGWQGDTLWFQVTPPQEQVDTIPMCRLPSPVDILEIYTAVQQAAGDAQIQWHEIDKAVACRNGIPVVIGRKPE